MGARARRRTRPPNPTEREQLVRSFDHLGFGVRGATDLPDTEGIRYGDRVAVYLEATCVDVIERTSRDGRSERQVVLEAYDGYPIRIIDELVGRKRRKRRKVKPA